MAVKYKVRSQNKNQDFDSFIFAIRRWWCGPSDASDGTPLSGEPHDLPASPVTGIGRKWGCRGSCDAMNERIRPSLSLIKHNTMDRCRPTEKARPWPTLPKHVMFSLRARDRAVAMCTAKELGLARKTISLVRTASEEYLPLPRVRRG